MHLSVSLGFAPKLWVFHTGDEPVARTHRIAVIPGDGIGKEVAPEGQRVLEAAARRCGISLELTHIDWASCDYYLRHIDILTARFVLQAQRFDVVVASNLFGDILSDLGPACTGTIGLAPSANLNPERGFPSLFEPVHGSAPDIYGQNIANPIAMIWSGALMLDFLDHGQGAGRAAHDAIVRATETVLREGPRTRDLGGRASTSEIGQAIAALV
jgi:isocitrate/isopropylmalate dehydrogenase